MWDPFEYFFGPPSGPWRRPKYRDGIIGHPNSKRSVGSKSRSSRGFGTSWIPAEGPAETMNTPMTASENICKDGPIQYTFEKMRKISQHLVTLWKWLCIYVIDYSVKKENKELSWWKMSLTSSLLWGLTIGLLIFYLFKFLKRFIYPWENCPPGKKKRIHIVYVNVSWKTNTVGCFLDSVPFSARCSVRHLCLGSVWKTLI